MKKILFIAFVITSLIQLAVPFKMMWEKERVLANGPEYKFRTAPVDPYDPFRGKYITLSFDANTYETPEVGSWKKGDDVFVILTTDSAGYAEIAAISKTEPGEEKLNVDYVKATVNYVYDNNIRIDYGFNRFYMEESKAFDAEVIYRQSNRDAQHETYALVNVKQGEAALKDVMIGNTSIRVLAGKAKEAANTP